MMKEYGGYLPIELPAGEAFYQGRNVIPLNSGRYAIAYALQELEWDTIYLPLYICATVEETIKKYLPQLKICYYHIDENFLPEVPVLGEQDCLLWVNYFGIQPDYVIDRMVKQYGRHLLIDNTQAFFTAPRQEICQVYSCRKFFGVSDGSYVIGENMKKRSLPTSSSSPYSLHLLHSFEHGTNYSYSLNKENEERLGHCEIEAMSPLTTAILRAVNYTQVAEQRKQNMAALHNILGKYNQISIHSITPALYYPFLFSGEELREQLIQNKIYVPKLWKETADNPFSSPWEKYLSDHLCPLPVDQRYNEEDMQFIGNLILKFIDKS